MKVDYMGNVIDVSVHDSIYYMVDEPYPHRELTLIPKTACKSVGDIDHIGSLISEVSDHKAKKALDAIYTYLKTKELTKAPLKVDYGCVELNGVKYQLEELLTRSEALEYLGVSNGTFAKHTRSGKIKPVNDGDYKHFYEKSELEAIKPKLKIWGREKNIKDLK